MGSVPVWIDFRERKDGDDLSEALEEYTRDRMPSVFIGGYLRRRPHFSAVLIQFASLCVGGLDAVRELHKAGKLSTMLSEVDTMSSFRSTSTERTPLV